MKVLRLFVPLAVLLLALLAERTRVENNAAVVCRGSGLGLECTVTNHSRAGTLNVFWDARLRCRTGTVVRANASQRVPPDAQFIHLIPLADLRGLDKCDAGQSLVVENVIARNSR